MFFLELQIRMGKKYVRLDIILTNKRLEETAYQEIVHI